MKLASLLKETKANKYGSPDSFKMPNGLTVTGSNWTPEQTRAFSAPVAKPAIHKKPRPLDRISPVYSFTDTGEKKDTFTRMTKENSPDSNWKERMMINNTLAANQGKLKERRLQGLNQIEQIETQNRFNQQLNNQERRTPLQSLNQVKKEKPKLAFKDRANLLLNINKDYESAKQLGQIAQDEGGNFMPMQDWVKQSNPSLYDLAFSTQQDESDIGIGPKTGKMRQRADGSYTNILPTAAELLASVTKQPKQSEQSKQLEQSTIPKLKTLNRKKEMITIPGTNAPQQGRLITSYDPSRYDLLTGDQAWTAKNLNDPEFYRGAANTFGFTKLGKPPSNGFKSLPVSLLKWMGRQINETKQLNENYNK